MAVAPSAASKCFLVTGPPGIGKTTLVMRVVETLKSSHPHLNIQGFYTREIREGSERVGFEVVTLDGRSGTLASSKISSFESLRWPNVGKYKVDVASFESLALPELQVKDGTDLFIIDEVGKMEMFSSAFFPAVMRVIESNTPVLATIPIPKFGRDIPGVARLRNHPGAVVLTLNKGNRDEIKEHIYAQLAGTCVHAFFSFWLLSLDSTSSSYGCSFESLRWPNVGKYKVDVASFESLALSELQVKDGTDLFIIDEVGKMEMFSSAFFPAVMRVIESNIPILATIPIPKFGRDIPGVARLRNHPGAVVLTLNRGNRDEIKEHIYAQLVNLLRAR